MKRPWGAIRLTAFYFGHVCLFNALNGNRDSRWHSWYRCPLLKLILLDNPLSLSLPPSLSLSLFLFIFSYLFLLLFYRLIDCFLCSPPGGTQVQDFTAVVTGDEHARADGLSLQQGASLYVTIVAENAAGLYTRIIAEPVTVDNTPPEVCCVSVGVGGEDGVEYIGADGGEVELMIKWQAEDLETGVSLCHYGLGE